MRAPISVIIQCTSAQNLAFTLASLAEGLAEGLIREVWLACEPQSHLLSLASAAGVEWSPSLNDAIERVSGHSLMILSDGASLSPGWAEMALRQLSKAPEVDLVLQTCTTCGADTTILRRMWV